MHIFAVPETCILVLSFIQDLLQIISFVDNDGYKIKSFCQQGSVFSSNTSTLCDVVTSTQVRNLTVIRL